jgi:hypothetical protein
MLSKASIPNWVVVVLAAVFVVNHRHSISATSEPVTIRPHEPQPPSTPETRAGGGGETPPRDGPAIEWLLGSGVAAGTVLVLAACWW